MRIFLISIGIVSTVLGLIGVVLPLLPTTPFVLLAAICFARSSDRFHDWLISTKVYKAYVLEFQKNRGFTLRQKFKMLLSLYIVVGFSFWMIDHPYIRMGLVIMVILQTVVLFTLIRTLPDKG
ncbi:YbaN family protein [Macrococcus brunensis]|uniref:YbaN family protein n=1 Tax=Macrococcus brunensis TaxID=198483 RepID=UPI001EF03D2C|nr:YbaN family protein [Macrococcus brunensis]ULG72827.1 YbaN family protein [Macrococcus brunensis]ULG75077.1 YbaN family protein [Macrococcus brunensis]